MLFYMLSKYGKYTRLLKIKNQLKIGCFYKKKLGRIFCGCFTTAGLSQLVEHLTVEQEVLGLIPGANHYPGS